jgi:hypothetical protein
VAIYKANNQQDISIDQRDSLNDNNKTIHTVRHKIINNERRLPPRNNNNKQKHFDNRANNNSNNTATLKFATGANAAPIKNPRTFKDHTDITQESSPCTSASIQQHNPSNTVSKVCGGNLC